MPSNIEIVDRILVQQLAREGGLAALPGTGEDRDRIAGQGSADRVEKVRALDHHAGKIP
jgi:hypothetical protein